MDSPDLRSTSGRPRDAWRAALLVLLCGLAALGAAAWTGTAGARVHPRSISAADRAGVEDALRLYLALSIHLRAAGGDLRYAERMSADPEVTDEMVGEVQFLARARRVEVPRLVKLEVLEVRPSAFAGASVRTKEFWITQEEGSGRPARSDVVAAKYELKRLPRGWQIASWQVDLPEPARGGR